MNQEGFVFTDGDFSQSHFSTLREMRELGHLCDVTIKVKNVSFTAHRLVLAAVIPYFRSMFTSNMKESRMKEITMENIDPYALEFLIDFAYTNQLRITDDNVRPLLRTATYLQLDSVAKACLNCFRDAINLTNVLILREWAYFSDDAIAVVDRFINENFEEVSMSEKFLDLSFDDLKAFIGRDDLHVINEEVVFQSVIRWVRACEIGRTAFLPELLHHVRMLLIKPQYFSSEVYSDLIGGSVLCKNTVEEALNHQFSRSRESTSLDWMTRERYCKERHHLKCAARRGYGLYARGYRYDMTHITYYDQINQKWTTLTKTDGTPSRYVVCFQDKICIIHAKETEVICLQTLEYSSEPVESPFRAGIALHDGKIYFFGGHIDNDLTDNILCLDLQNFECVQKGSMTIRRFCLSCASLDDHVYITGGQCEPNVAVSSVERYNFNTETVAAISPMLEARYEHQSAAVNGKIYVCGGRVGERIFSSCEVYDPTINRWTSVSDMNISCGKICLFTLENKLVAFNPFDTEVKFETFDDKGSQWKTELSLVFPSGLHTSTIFVTNSASVTY